MKTTVVYVELLNEGTPTWRPTQAKVISDNVCELLPTPNYDPLDEEWAFLPGSKVICEKRPLVGYGNKKSEELVAIGLSSPSA